VKSTNFYKPSTKKQKRVLPLEKLKNRGLVNVQRESTFLRYSANTETLQDLLGFLYAECCTHSHAIEPEAIVQIVR